MALPKGKSIQQMSMMRGPGEEEQPGGVQHQHQQHQQPAGGQQQLTPQLQQQQQQPVPPSAGQQAPVHYQHQPGPAAQHQQPLQGAQTFQHQTGAPQQHQQNLVGISAAQQHAAPQGTRHQPQLVQRQPPVPSPSNGRAAGKGKGAALAVPDRGRRLQDLLRDVDPSFQLENEAEDFILQMAEEFVEQVTRPACDLAKHRKSQELETRDLQLVLEKHWNIKIPLPGSQRAPLKVPLYARPAGGARLVAVGSAPPKKKAVNRGRGGKGAGGKQQKGSAAQQAAGAGKAPAATVPPAHDYLAAAAAAAENKHSLPALYNKPAAKSPSSASFVISGGSSGPVKKIKLKHTPAAALNAVTAGSSSGGR